MKSSVTLRSEDFHSSSVSLLRTTHTSETVKMRLRSSFCSKTMQYTNLTSSMRSAKTCLTACGAAKRTSLDRCQSSETMFGPVSLPIIKHARRTLDAFMSVMDLRILIFASSCDEKVQLENLHLVKVYTINR